MVELEGEGAAAKGPVGDVAGFVGDAAAWDSVSEMLREVKLQAFWCLEEEEEENVQG